ncbi:hypothetical protein CR513_21950, partial [Mucuna pruriens]
MSLVRSDHELGRVSLFVGSTDSSVYSPPSIERSDGCFNSKGQASPRLVGRLDGSTVQSITPQAPSEMMGAPDKACIARNKAHNLNRITHASFSRCRVIPIGGAQCFSKPPQLSNYQIGTVAGDTSSFVSFSSNINPDPNLFQEPEQMENNDQMLKELATLDVVYQPWCIQYPQLEPAQSYKLKSSLIHLLPKFHGLAGEDPHKHLKEFHVVCSIMRPQGIPKDYIKMKAFPFSLDGAVKDWLYLQPVLFNTWGDMKRMFLEKFFPTFRTATTRKEICGIRQHSGETLHEY